MPTPQSRREDVKRYLDRIAWQRAEEDRLLDLEGYDAGAEREGQDGTI